MCGMFDKLFVDINTVFIHGRWNLPLSINIAFAENKL